MTVFTTILLLGALLPGCFGGATRSPDQDFKNFVTAASRASSDGYTMYWLGRSFSAGGLTFQGPGVPDFGGEVDGGGVALGYAATLLSGGGVSLSMTIFSAKAWALGHSATASALLRNGASRQITIANLTGTMRTVPNQYTRTQSIALQLDAADGEVLVVGTGPSIGRSPGVDLNPLTDEQTFLSVMQNLRPYPQ